MPADPDTFVVAAAQATPVYLNRSATVDKVCAIITEASEQDARLVVFPESFVPGYPDWVWTMPPGDAAAHADLHYRLLASALTVDGPEIDRIADAARVAGAHVVLGATLRNSEASGTSLYNALLFFDPEEGLVGVHRKLVPTGGERLVWARGDGASLKTYDTPMGKLGGLICWENYMPLARYVLAAQGEDIHAAPTWDHGEPWLSTLRHIARESRAVVVGCCMPLQLADIPDDLAFKALYPAGTDWINTGGSAIVGPDGKFLAGPLHEAAGLLLAEVDRRRLKGARAMLDIAGHYARPDVFHVTVRSDAQPMIALTGAEDAAAAPDPGPQLAEGGPDQ